jgi:hypothetical protein
MSETPLPSDEGLPASDQAVLALLSSGWRDDVNLSTEQEALLDHWVAGQASAEEATSAAELVRKNVFAAERVLERRLLAAAAAGPAVPSSLSARVLQSHAQPSARPSVFRWFSVPRWQWSSIGGALAAAAVLMVVGVQNWPAASTVQVALASIGDRNLVFEPGDVRMRGAPGTPRNDQDPARDQRYRDIQMPAALLKRLLTGAGTTKSDVEIGEIDKLLDSTDSHTGGSLYVALDPILTARISAASQSSSIPVRVYDLRDSRTSEIREKLAPLPRAGRAYLITSRF